MESRLKSPVLLTTAALLLFCTIEAISQNPGEKRPLVIAHRGSSGMMPEHTVPAYELAVQQGADSIECDLAVTKDLQLLCTHEAWLNATTDVHFHPEFSDRIRTYFVSLKLMNITDYFTIDFTLDELKTLKRVQVLPFRDQSFNGMFSVASFEDYIAVAKSANRTVHIYVETKNPLFFNHHLQNQNTSIENLLLSALEKNNYIEEDSPCFIESFSLRSLEYMSKFTPLPLIYLVKTNLTSAEMFNMSNFVTGLGPDKELIVKVDQDTNRIKAVTDFVGRAHKAGLVVHPYVFRNEHMYLAFDYGTDPYREYELLITIGVDGLFTDFPWSLVNYLDMEK